jgi:hypothetical protein
VRFEFKSGTVLFCFSFIFVSFENHVCLPRGVQVSGTIWRAATRTMAGVGDVVQWTGNGRTDRKLDGWAVERSSGAVCSLHLTRED